MAVQFDNPADRLSHNGVYPQTSAGWTYTAWVRIDTDLNTFSTWLRLSSGSSTIATCGTSTNGTGGPNYFTAFGSAQSATDLSSPPTGVWVPVAGSRPASGVGVKCYVKRSGTGTTELIFGGHSQGDITGIPDQICIGGRGSADPGEPFSGSIAYVRVWSSELTQAEIEAEWASPTPVKTSTLHSNWPLSTNTDLTDTVGSKTLAVQSGGALTTVTGPSLGPSTVSGVLAGSLPAFGGSLTGSVSSPGGPTWVRKGTLGLQSYEYEQLVPQSVWTIPHGLGRFPVAWSLFDEDGRECSEFVVQHLDSDTTLVSMDVPTAGLIRLI